MIFKIRTEGYGFPKRGQLIQRNGTEAWLITEVKETGAFTADVTAVHYESLDRLNPKERTLFTPVKILSEVF